MWNLRVLSTLLFLASVYGLIEKIDLMEATEDILIEQMDGIVDSVSDEHPDIGSKTSSSDQSSSLTTPSILIAVYSGLTAGASWGFLGATLRPHLGDIPAIHLSPNQVLSLYMTFLGSYGVSTPLWGLLRDAPKQVEQHRTKNSLFGEGIYLASDLGVCLAYSSRGVGWANSCLVPPCLASRSPRSSIIRMSKCTPKILGGVWWRTVREAGCPRSTW